MLLSRAKEAWGGGREAERRAFESVQGVGEGHVWGRTLASTSECWLNLEEKVGLAIP